MLHVYGRLSLGVFRALCLSMICGRTWPRRGEPYIFYEMPCLNGDKDDRAAEPFLPDCGQCCRTTEAMQNFTDQWEIVMVTAGYWRIYCLLHFSRITHWHFLYMFQNKKARNAHKRSGKVTLLQSLKEQKFIGSQRKIFSILFRWRWGVLIMETVLVHQSWDGLMRIMTGLICPA